MNLLPAATATGDSPVPAAAPAKPSSGRRLDIDLARGLVIILVATVHHPAHAPQRSQFAFFWVAHIIIVSTFLSGFVHKTRPFSVVAPTRFRILVWPMILTTLVVVPLRMLWKDYGFDAAGPEAARSIYATGITLYLFQTWYLPMLWIVEVLYGAIDPWLQRIGRAGARYLLLAACALAGSGLIHWVNDVATPDWLLRWMDLPASFSTFRLVGLPWSIDLVPFSLAIYWMGAEWRKLELEPKLFRLRYLVPAVILYTAETLIIPEQTDLNLRQLGRFEWVMPSIVLKAAIMCGFSYWVAQRYSNRLTDLVAKLGRYSLVVLIFHVMFMSFFYRVLLAVLPETLQPVSVTLSYATGLLGPVLLYDHVLDRIPYLRKVFLTIRHQTYAPPALVRTAVPAATSVAV